MIKVLAILSTGWRAGLALTALSGLFFTSTPVRAEDASIATALSEEVRSVFERVKESVVKIEASDKNGQLIGTGFFIDPNGTLLTSYSVGGESINIVVSYGEKKCPAKRLTADPRSGIAILQLEKGRTALPFLPLGKSRELKVASPVIMVAYPMDLPKAPNFGMIAGFERKYLNRYFATTHLRANVPVQRGEGGAPLLNMKGEVVGVVISSLEGGASCFAVPSEAINKIHRDYLRFGAPRPGRLGLRVHPMEENASSGTIVSIETVEEGGPAHEAGLQPNDILQKIGPYEISAPEDVLNAVFFLTAGDPVDVTVLRDGKSHTVSLEPVERNALSIPKKGRLSGKIIMPMESREISLRPVTADETP